MKDCCVEVKSTGALDWTAVERLLAGVPAADLPPQMSDGINGVMDIPGAGSPSQVGDVLVTVAPGTPDVWTENWVVSTGAVFTDGSRTTRLQLQAASGTQARPSGAVEATMVFSYQPGSSAPAWPDPAGTILVFDVYNGPVGSMTLKGRLFRRNHGTNQTQDWWLLYPGYVKPIGTTVAELRPNGGDPAASWADARQKAQPSGGMYVPIQYTRNTI